MASITGNGSNGHHKFILTVSETSTSTANNTSSISFTFQIAPIQTSWNWSDWGTSISYTVTINGTKYTGSVSAYDGYSTVTLKSGTQTVTHNTDGSKSISYSFSVSDTSGTTYTSGAASASGTLALTTISRYATVNQTLHSKTETTITMNWSSDNTIDYVWYSTDWGTNWIAVGSANATSGSYTISKDAHTGGSITANATYNIITRVRRKDSQLTTDSSKLSVTTYDYPYCTDAPSFTIGNAITLSFYNPLSRTITITGYGADGSKIFGGSTEGTSLKGFNDSESIEKQYNSIPNAKSGTYTVNVTYSGNTAETTGGTYSVAGNEVPTVGTLTYFDNDSTIVAITGNNQHIVQNYSSLVARIGSATANKGASISTYTVECNGVTVSGTSAGDYSIGAMDSSTNINLKLTVTDTRGLTASKTVTVTILAHSAPSAAVTLKRLNNYEDETYLTVNGTISSVNGKNAMTIKYRYMLSGDSYGAYTVIDDAQKYTLSLDKNNSYIFNIVITDTFGATSSKEYVLGKGVFPLFIDTELNSVGINGFPTSALDLFVNGAIVAESGTTDNGNWIKYYDGTMICHHLVTTGTYDTTTCASEVAWTFPQAFKSLGTTRVLAQPKGGNEYAYFCLVSVDYVTGCTVQLKGMPQTETRYIDTSGRSIDVIAIGRWK